MPLVVSTLASQIEAVLMSMPKNGALAAEKLAAAYDSYCQAGLAGGAKPVFTGSEKPALQGMLTAALASSKGTPAQFGKAWADGINMYWALPPVPFSTPPIVGVVTAMPGAAAAAGAIAGIISNGKNTPASAAQGIANALDVATKTVLVTFSAPPPPAGPPPPATVV